LITNITKTMCTTIRITKTERKLAILLFYLLVFNSITRGDNYPVGARSAGMMNATVMLSDVWSGFHNQAGLAWIESIEFGAHFENQFFMEEMSLKSAVFALPTNKSGVFGLNFSYFGNPSYNESKVGLAYSKTFSDYFAVGIQLDYFNTNIYSDYGNQGTAVAEIGLRAIPIKNLYLGAHVFNLTRSKIDFYEEEPIPTIFRVGAGYNFADRFLLTTEVEKTIEYKPVIKAGAEYRLLDNLFLRGGISSESAKYAFGMGIIFRKIHADFAFSKHQILGYSTHISMHISF